MPNSLMTPKPETSGGGRFREVLLEALLVLVCGGLFALAANFLSPRGLSLSRDYFPGDGQVSAADPLAARLKAQGLRMVDYEQAVAAFRDPRREQELIVFVDARNGTPFEAGHLPGAYLFDHFHPENHLPDLLPVCLTAETILIYCTGGNCEDSEFAATTLAEAGVAKEKLVVYPGGISEWQAKGQPVETGPRNSGKIRPNP